MANISLKNFVDVNIQRSARTKPLGTRTTAVILTDEGEEGIITGITKLTYTSLLSSYTQTSKYAQVFFANGGEMLDVITGVSYDTSDATATSNTIAEIVSILKELENEKIVVAFAWSDQTSELTSYDVIKRVAQSMNSDTSVYGINEKIILARSVEATDIDSTKNFAVKYSSVIGAEMTIGAYLTQINVYGVNTIKDYAFTQETLDAEDIDNTTFNYLIDNNYNVDIDLQGIVRNCGGNTKTSADSIVNLFARIVLQQTLTERLVTLLTSKVQSSDGISKMYATIVDELEYYRTNGFLTTDKIWEYDDWVSDDGIVVIEKGTPLLTGYQVKIAPFSSLTPTEKAQHKAPKVYVVLADQYSIRVIQVRGEVI